MKVIYYCWSLTVLTLVFGKKFLKEIPNYVALTKEIDHKGITVAEAFANYALYKVTIDQVDLIYYSQEDIEGTKVAIDDAQQIKKTKFNKNLKTIFVVHGWQNTCGSLMCSLIHDSLLKNNDLNVFIVCWDKPANTEYLEAHAAVSQVGKFLGDFIRNLSISNEYDLSKIGIVGHSLGAHVAGWAGKENNGGLRYIVGLDPAGPLFLEWDTDNRLDETDAQYVQGIHTDAVALTGLGVDYSVGSVDFWPNGGAGQPGCGSDFLGMCAHGRSYELFAESINDNKFFSRKCTKYLDYIKGKCTENAHMYLGGCQFSEITEDLKGNYYLETDESSPYGVGNIGL